MTPTIQDAFKAARRPRDSQGYWRPAAVALPMARRALADLAEAEARATAARAALAAAREIDGRRYAPGMVAARSELEAAEARARALRAATWPTRPVGRGDYGATLGAPWSIGGYRSAVLQWCEAPPFRYAGTAEELADLRHSGHYLDPDGDGDTATGVVYQLTARDGRAVYLPAIADPYNGRPGRGPAMLAIRDMVTADDSTEGAAEEARRDAARRADQLAEYYAESERDWQAAFRAGQEARAKAAEARAEGLAYVEAVRALRARLKARHCLGLVGLTPDDARALIRAAVAAVRETCESYQEAREAAFDLIRDSQPGRHCYTLDGWREGYREGVPH